MLSSPLASASSLASTIPRNFRIQSPKPTSSYLLHFPISTPHNLRFASFKTHSNFSSQEYQEEEEEEELAIGDCLVFEEGIFDDPFLQNDPKPPPQVSTNPTRKKKTAPLVSAPTPENLIPDKWAGGRTELNITKKERRKLSKELEYGKNVERRRKGLLPIDSEEYERFKNEKLQHLNPVVLDKPLVVEIKSFEEDEKDEERGEEVVRGRVAGRNPRLAVYGVGLEDVSELFNSGRYDPEAKGDKKGPQKLFTKEEKMLLNKRVPDLAVATSGKWHPLHTLVATGEFFLVNSLLKHNHDINAPDKDGLTAVHRAILGKKQAIFNYLLRESANPFVRDEGGATLLHYAVFSSSSQMIKILLLYNVDINLQDNDGWTPLHLAVQSRRTDIVRLLLIKGADKTLKNQEGLTPLELCLYSGEDLRTYELIRLLKRIPSPQWSKKAEDTDSKHSNQMQYSFQTPNMRS